MLRRSWSKLWPLLAVVVLVTVVGALTYAQMRLRVPAEISVVVLAAVAARRAIGGAGRVRREPAPPDAAIVASRPDPGVYPGSAGGRAERRVRSMKRIGVLVVAYNAALDARGRCSTASRATSSRGSTKVLVSDDHSQDATYLVGLGYQQTTQDLPLEIIRHPRNLGYGGNQKAGYRWAIEHGLDIVVLLHGDGQYAPELLPEMVAPLERGEADAVFGSRMMSPGDARQGGMPLYKYVGNRSSPASRTRWPAASLTEWHSGYRAYSVDALRELPFEQQLRRLRLRHPDHPAAASRRGCSIAEIPIPTYYGDEICYVNGLGYAARRHEGGRALPRCTRWASAPGETAFADDHYELKHGDDTSHGRILDLRRPHAARADPRPRLRRRLARRAAARSRATRSPASTSQKHEGVGDRLDRFVEADLDDGIPPEVGRRLRRRARRRRARARAPPRRAARATSAAGSRPAGAS